MPGHVSFQQVAEQVKKGIHRAGGTVVEFGTIGICDGVAKNNFNYVLPSREIICDSVETMAGANPIDGLILLASCDKIVPGMLMAAAAPQYPRDSGPRGSHAGRAGLWRTEGRRNVRIRGIRHVQDRTDFSRGVRKRRGPLVPDLRFLLLHGNGKHHVLSRRGHGHDPHRWCSNTGCLCG